MNPVPVPRSVFTTPDFERWWDARGRVAAAECGLEPAAARVLSWLAWRAGREHLNETTAHQRLQPARR